MTIKLIITNLLRRPVRTAVSVSAVAAMVAMVLIITGLINGTLGQISKRMESLGADIMVQPPGASAFLLFSSAKMPMRLGDELRAIPEVSHVAPVVISTTIRDRFEVIYGIDFESYNRIGAPFNFYSGGPFASPYEVIVDSVRAKEYRLRVGDAYKILGREFRISGIVEPGKGSRLYIPLETAQQLSGAASMVTLFFVRCASPEAIDAVASQIRARLPSYTVRPLREYYRYFSQENLTGLNVFLQALTLVAVIVSLLVILLTMYTAILERMREIGILKSLGASRRFIVAVLLAEALAVCILGLALGFGLTFAAQRFNAHVFPTRPIYVPEAWMIRAALICLTSGLLGALYPALRAARLDPVEAINSV